MSSARNQAYCPEYDLFLIRSKRELQGTFQAHFEARDAAVRNYVNDVLEEVEPNAAYNHTFVDPAMDEMADVLLEYKGPELRKKINNYKQFAAKVKNRFFQHRFKWEGKFIAMHLHRLRTYVDTLCGDDSNKADYIKTAIISRLFAGKIKQIVSQTGERKIITAMTVFRSNPKHNSLWREIEQLCPEINVAAELKRCKSEKKIKLNKKVGGEEFYQHLSEFIGRIYSQKQTKWIKANCTDDDDECMFVKETEEFDKEDFDPLFCSSYSKRLIAQPSNLRIKPHRSVQANAFGLNNQTGNNQNNAYWNMKSNGMDLDDDDESTLEYPFYPRTEPATFYGTQWNEEEIEFNHYPSNNQACDATQWQTCPDRSTIVDGHREVQDWQHTCTEPQFGSNSMRIGYDSAYDMEICYQYYNPTPEPVFLTAAASYGPPNSNNCIW